MRAGSVCAESGCPRTATYRGYCERHRARPWEGSYARRKALGGIPLAPMKRRVRRRAGGSCERCGNLVELAGGIVDHRVPVAEGGETTDANLWLLCAECDRVKTREDLARIRSSRSART